MGRPSRVGWTGTFVLPSGAVPGSIGGLDYNSIIILVGF